MNYWSEGVLVLSHSFTHQFVLLSRVHKFLFGDGDEFIEDYESAGAFFVSIPNCVLGGVTAFLFASIVVSGVQIIVLGGLARRTRLILSLSLALGLGKPQNSGCHSLQPSSPHLVLCNIVIRASKSRAASHMMQAVAPSSFVLPSM
jgi:hypothetical protein